MKKNILLMVAAGVFVVAACTKPQEVVNTEPVTEPEEEVVNTNKVMLFVSSNAAPETKVIDNYTAGATSASWLWEKGDEIGVWDSGSSSFEKFTLASGAGSKQAVFEGKLSDSYDVESSYVVYPYSSASNGSSTSFKMTCDYETLNEGRFVPLFGTITKKDNGYTTTLNHLVSVVKVSFKNAVDAATTGEVWFETYVGNLLPEFNVTISNGEASIETNGCNYFHANALPSHKVGDDITMYVPIKPGTYTKTGEPIFLITTVKKSEGGDYKKQNTTISPTGDDGNGTYEFIRGTLYVMPTIDLGE